MADDLAQQTSLRALDRAASFLPGTHLDRWLFTVARRLWLNDLRATKTRRGAGLVVIEDEPQTDPAPPIEVNIFAGEVFDLVQALPEAQRLSVLLVYVEGYTYKEAADLQGIPIGTIMSRLATARRVIARQTASSETDT